MILEVKLLKNVIMVIEMAFCRTFLQHFPYVIMFIISVIIQSSRVVFHISYCITMMNEAV